MSVIGIDNSIATNPESGTFEESDLFSRITLSAVGALSSLTENHGYLITTAAVCASGAYLLYRNYRSKAMIPNSNVLLKMQEGQKANPDEIQTYLRRFISHELESAKTQKNIRFNESSKQFLAKKIDKILNAAGTTESKKTIIQNVTQNFINDTETVQKRIKIDLESGKLNYLGIDETDKSSEFIPIGDETHNNGMVPYKITFQSGKSIIYKPRSVLPEKLICDSEQGLLRDEGFGTYRVLSQEDHAGEYGYCQFLENKIAENTINTANELEEYVKKIEKLELIARELGLSDLHYQNIITDKLNPCIIDAEVFLNPPEMESGLFEHNGPLHLFADEYSKAGGNRIWIEIDEIKQEIKKNPRNYRKIEQISEDCWLNMGFDFRQKCENVSLQPSTLNQIQNVKAKLTQKLGRYVLVPTADLTNILKSYTDARATKEILETIKLNCEESNFEFLSENEQNLIEAIQYDVGNNDCPITFFNIGTGLVYYCNKKGEIPIALKRGPVL